MHDRSIVLQTQTLNLRCWQERHRQCFRDMNSDPEVMDDLGGPLSTEESDEKFDRYVAAFDEYGFSRWAIEDLDGRFHGYVGIVPRRIEHPLGPHDEIGWRLIRNAWGKGYATEGAKAALDDVFSRIGLTEVLSYTSPDNIRSQRVMSRLNLQRDPSRDFLVNHPGMEPWHGLVWVARRQEGFKLP